MAPQILRCGSDRGNCSLATGLVADHSFLFWNSRHPGARPGLHPQLPGFPGRLVATKVSGDLSLVHTNYYYICLGFETLSGSSGFGPGTLTSRVEVGVQISLYVVLQVSTCFILLDV